MFPLLLDLVCLCEHVCLCECVHVRVCVRVHACVCVCVGRSCVMRPKVPEVGAHVVKTKASVLNVQIRPELTT